MATFSQSTLDKGSDIFQDFLCSACQGKKLDTMADFYCELCLKFYCGNCINLHSQLFTNHATFGRKHMKKWPVTKKVEDFLLKCDVHKEENLKMFCDEHSELCCTNCAFLNHRHCTKVTLISDIVKIQSTDLKKLSVSIQIILEEMRKLQGNQEASLQYMQYSFDEQLQKIHETRRKINAALDTIEQKTLNEMKDTLTKLQASCKNDVDKCISLQDELKQLRDAIQDISDKSKLGLSFIATRKCKDKIQHCETFLKKNSLPGKVSITFQPNNEIVQYLSKLSGLGKIEHSTQTLMGQEDPNMVFTLQGKSVHNVRISSDSKVCKIIAICVLPEGQVLVADDGNNTIKLFDQHQVVSHCSVTTSPYDMCQITPSEVAVTVALKSEVQFITVNNTKLVTGRKLQLKHTCFGIACNQEDLYITNMTALYKYTLSGKQVSKMYEDKSGALTVFACAVSPTGDKLYITNNTHDKVLTLARDGSVLATFTDPHALVAPRGVHVTPAGQVLVCGGDSYTIIQVDDEGRKKLAILATQKDGVASPRSVCYNRHTASILVGLFKNNNILVFKVQ